MVQGCHEQRRYDVLETVIDLHAPVEARRAYDHLIQYLDRYQVGLGPQVGAIP